MGKFLKGIIPVQYCPYTKNDELDLRGLKQNTEYLIKFAKRGHDLSIMTNGSTTECYANSIKEQKMVIKTVVETVDNKVPVIVGVSQPSVKESIKMAKYAEKIGADYAMVMNPYYHAPTKEGLFEFYKNIAEAVEIDIIMYNNATVSGVLMPPGLVKKLSYVSNITALKDNSTNIDDLAFKAMKIDPNDMTLIAGEGEVQFIGAAAYGYNYKGFVSFIATFAPELSCEIYRQAFVKQDFNKALKALNKIEPIFDLISKFMDCRSSISIIPKVIRTNYMYMSVGKAAMDLVGLNGGSLRLPCEDLTKEEKNVLEDVLKNMKII